MSEEKKLVQVVALQRGHDGDSIRNEGDVFLIAADRLDDGSTWFVKADSEEAKSAKTEPATGAGRGKK